MLMFRCLMCLVVCFQCVFAYAISAGTNVTSYKVTSIWGTHFYKSSGSKQWRKLEPERLLSKGDEVRTLADGFVKIGDGKNELTLKSQSLVVVTQDLFETASVWTPKLPFATLRGGEKASQQGTVGSVLTVFAKNFPAEVLLDWDSLGIDSVMAHTEISLWTENMNGLTFRRLKLDENSLTVKFSEPGLYTIEAVNEISGKKKATYSYVRVLNKEIPFDEPLLPRDWQGHEKIVLN